MPKRHTCLERIPSVSVHKGSEQIFVLAYLPYLYTICCKNTPGVPFLKRYSLPFGV
ncbi:hypothetical protein M2298_001195 [Brevibacillus sp. 1238]|jgi:hypothetical protein|nr:hypothetical protein [Brevibacillus sp. 1238]